MTARRASQQSISSRERPTLWPRGLSRVQAAEYIGTGTTLFDEMIRDGRMPKPKQINGRVVWDRFALDAAFDALPDKDSRNPWDDAA